MAMVSNHFAQELIWRCFVRTRTQVRKNESLAVAGMLTRRIQIPWASPKRHKKNSNNARHLSTPQNPNPEVRETKNHGVDNKASHWYPSNAGDRRRGRAPPGGAGGDGRLRHACHPGSRASRQSPAVAVAVAVAEIYVVPSGGPDRK